MRFSLPADALARSLPDGNDGTVRDLLWRRYPGDAWDAFDALPVEIRRRIADHAYDAWSVNALLLWRRFRRLHGAGERAERALLRYIDHCERLERRAFSAAWTARHGTPFPHDAARVGVLRATTRRDQPAPSRPAGTGTAGRPSG